MDAHRDLASQLSIPVYLGKVLLSVAEKEMSKENTSSRREAIPTYTSLWTVVRKREWQRGECNAKKIKQKQGRVTREIWLHVGEPQVCPILSHGKTIGEASKELCFGCSKSCGNQGG